MTKWVIIIFMENKTKNKNVKKSEKMTEKSHPLLTKVAVRLTTIITITVLAVAVFLIVSTHIKRTFFTEKKEIHEAMVTQQLLSVQELITQKYRYSDIITLKKSLGFSKSYSIIKFTGVIRAGIENISSASFEISSDKTSISIKLPRSAVLGNEIIDQSVFDEKRSVFVPITTQEIFDEIDSVRNSIAEEILGEGFLDEADREAQRFVSQMMYALGFETVKVSN